MRKLIITLITPIVIFSCKKDNAIIDGLRIMKTEHIDAGALQSVRGFNYNEQGQITSISAIGANGASTVLATITYNGATITITPPPTNSIGVDAVSEIRYTLNASGQPLQRIETSAFHFKPPNNQNDYAFDTINYEYSGDFLVKTRGSSYDSSWSASQNGDIQIRIHKPTFTANYTNTGNRLTQISKHTNTAVYTRYNSSIYTGQDTRTETITFGYTKEYGNRTDFTNSVVLSELGVLVDNTYPLNKAYSNFPDEVNYVTTDTYGSAQPTTNKFATNATIAYSRFGFISNFDYGLYSRKIIYNKE